MKILLCEMNRRLSTIPRGRGVVEPGVRWTELRSLELKKKITYTLLIRRP